MSKQRCEPSQRSATRGRAATSLLARLLLVSISVVVALAIGEVAIRVLHLGPDLNVVYRQNFRLSTNPILQYELVPGSEDGRALINNAGLRDKEYPLEAPPKTFRILIIGDSIAYGFGVQQNETLSAQIEDLLAAHWPPGDVHFEALNLGVTGYSIEQVVENLRVRGLQYDPDFIIYAYCLNDPMAYSFELESLLVQLSGAKTTYREDLLRRGKTLVGKLRIYLLANYAWRARRAEDKDGTRLEDRQWTSIADGSYDRFFTEMHSEAEGLGRLKRGIEDLRHISRQTGIPVATVIFPVFHDLDAYRLAHLHRKVESLHSESGVPVYDLLPLYLTMFESYGSVFIHNALHPNAVGHRLAAFYILQELTRDELLPLSKPRVQQLLKEDRALASVVERTMQKRRDSRTSD
jgi:lysophospholipase L1-like esterase